METSVRVAVADDRVRDLAGRAELEPVSVELLVAKPAVEMDDADRPPPIPRRAEVLLASGGAGEGIRVVVNLDRRLVEEVTPIAGRSAMIRDTAAVPSQMPITRREAERARSLLFASPQILADLPVDPEETTVEYLPITRPEPEFCESGRCLELLFRRGDSYLTTTAVVDLITGTIRIRGARR